MSGSGADVHDLPATESAWLDINNGFPQLTASALRRPDPGVLTGFGVVGVWFRDVATATWEPRGLGSETNHERIDSGPQVLAGTCGGGDQRQSSGATVAPRLRHAPRP